MHFYLSNIQRLIDIYYEESRNINTLTAGICGTYVHTIQPVLTVRGSDRI
jgi:hypothetical protein